MTGSANLPRGKAAGEAPAIVPRAYFVSASASA